MLTFLVPPGIGDFSAMYAKLCLLNRDLEIISSNDQPQRLVPFLEILPKVKSSRYGHFGSGAVLTNTLAPGTDLVSLEDGTYFLSINEWLEHGGKVSDWVPGQTNYHYPFKISASMRSHAKSVVEKHAGKPLIGIYTSAYGNSRHWGFWAYHEWWTFLRMVHILMNDVVFVFIGADYDVMISDALYKSCLENGISSVYAVGSLHIGATVELIRSLDYFFSFPSGLGFIADVVQTPHIMWFPPHLDKMRGTFCDPELYGNGAQHRLFESPEDAFAFFYRDGIQFVRERCQKRLSAKLVEI